MPLKFLLALLVVFLPAIAEAADISGVAKVREGDTIHIGTTRIRLGGIDAPSVDQLCLNNSGERWTCGVAARDELAKYTDGKSWTCHVQRSDRRGRQVARCEVDGEDIQKWMVKNGWALSYVRFSHDYDADEKAAREAKAGMWQGAFIAPWDWRIRNKKTVILGFAKPPENAHAILLASASGAIVIAFGIRPDRKAMELAQQEHVDIRSHTIIYEVSDELKKAMEGLLEPVIQETHLGRAEVRNTFRVKGSGTVAGCYVVEGVLKRDAQIRVVRDGVVIYTSKLSSLKRFKDDASEVRTGFECGAGIANFNDVKVGDILECFSVQKLSAAEAAGQSVGTAGRK